MPDRPEMLVNKELCGRFARGDVPSQAAEGLAGDTQVGGDHVLGDALDAVGVGVHEFDIFLFRRLAEGAYEAALGGDEAVLDQDAEISFDCGHLIQQGFPGGAGDQQQLAVLEGFDIEKGGFVRKEAVEVGRPPAFERELQYMFVALFVDGV